MFAKIIVDVPCFQTDMPYTYLVPEELQALLAVGMRVLVPFGKGNRLVEGFVIERLTQVKEVPENLKSVQEILDIAPVIGPELMALSVFMKRQTFSFRISCLQTMIPSLMRADVEKFFWTEHLEDVRVQEIFKNDCKISWKVAERENKLYKLAKLRQEGLVEVGYALKKQNPEKQERVVQKKYTKKEYEKALSEVKANATAQRKLLETLLSLEEEEITKASLSKEYGITSESLSSAEKKGWVEIFTRSVRRNPFDEKKRKKSEPLLLNKEQEVAKKAIVTAMDREESNVFLLEGITGSGKTEVYLQVIAASLAKGKTAIMLVPEISLTPMMTQRFKNRFGDLVAILHSGLSQGEKYDEWRKLERGEAKVVVGARSAIFAPIENIGVLIIDEEHETSYKQDSNPRYHARDIAIWRGEYHHCPVVLGSATPSLESRARAQKKVYELLLLTERASQNALLPDVEIVDFKTIFGNTASKNFTPTLIEKIEKKLQLGNQIILMLNRRGYSSFMLCRTCGFVLGCPNCDISLTLHMDSRTMRCHYCGHEEGLPQSCSNCKSREIKYFGTGTQQVEKEIHALFPTARVLRMDVDTTRKKGAHEKILQQFGDGKADILLGTQMIAKGLDFENVTLVGIIQADTSLNLPDFRSAEKTFQLLTQVAGRSGRGEKKGEVVIQTYNPTHYAIELAAKQDYEAFYQREMSVRHLAGYPPFFYTIQVTVSHKEDIVAVKKIFEIFKRVKPHLSEQSQILGPSPRSIARMKNQYFYQLIIKYKFEENLQEVLENIVEEMQQEALKGLFVSIDKEPVNFF